MCDAMCRRGVLVLKVRPCKDPLPASAVEGVGFPDVQLEVDRLLPLLSMVELHSWLFQ